MCIIIIIKAQIWPAGVNPHFHWTNICMYVCYPQNNWLHSTWFIRPTGDPNMIFRPTGDPSMIFRPTGDLNMICHPTGDPNMIYHPTGDPSMFYHQTGDPNMIYHQTGDPENDLQPNWRP